MTIHPGMISGQVYPSLAHLVRTDFEDLPALVGLADDRVFSLPPATDDVARDKLTTKLAYKPGLSADDLKDVDRLCFGADYLSRGSLGVQQVKDLFEALRIFRQTSSEWRPYVLAKTQGRWAGQVGLRYQIPFLQNPNFEQLNLFLHDFSMIQFEISVMLGDGRHFMAVIQQHYDGLSMINHPGFYLNIQATDRTYKPGQWKKSNAPLCYEFQRTWDADGKDVIANELITIAAASLAYGLMQCVDLFPENPPVPGEMAGRIINRETIRRFLARFDD